MVSCHGEFSHVSLVKRVQLPAAIPYSYIEDSLAKMWLLTKSRLVQLLMYSIGIDWSSSIHQLHVPACIAATAQECVIKIIFLHDRLDRVYKLLVQLVINLQKKRLLAEKYELIEEYISLEASSRFYSVLVELLLQRHPAFLASSTLWTITERCSSSGLAFEDYKRSARDVKGPVILHNLITTSNLVRAALISQVQQLKIVCLLGCLQRMQATISSTYRGTNLPVVCLVITSWCRWSLVMVNSIVLIG